ncbi:transcription factor S-II domain-containing protein [Cryptosporidium serpentis]
MEDLLHSINQIKIDIERILSRGKLDDSKDETKEHLEKLSLININRQLLKSTKIGVLMTTVKRNYQSINIVDIADMADNLIRKWKNSLALEDKERSQSSQKSDSESLPKKVAKIDESYGLRTPEKGDISETANIKVKNVHNSYTGPLTGEPLRDKARQFLWKAFVMGVPISQAELMDPSQVCEISAEVESALYKEYIIKQGNSVRDYNLQLKTIKWNLGDLKNPELNSKLYIGKITPDEIATMHSREMASEAKQKEREKHKQESLEACQSDWDLRNLVQKEGQFTCGKCKTNKTTYFQMQTRSADEPMTTFVRCLNCGNRWKF